MIFPKNTPNGFQQHTAEFYFQNDLLCQHWHKRHLLAENVIKPLAAFHISVKYDGMENRRKIRLRVYSAAQASAKFEIKEKAGACQKKPGVAGALTALSAFDLPPVPISPLNRQ